MCPKLSLFASRGRGCSLRGSTYAEKMFFAAEEELALADGRGSEGFFAEIIFRPEVECRTGFDNVHFAFVVEKINVVLGRNERGVGFTEPLLPKNLASPGFEPGSDAAVRHHEEPITHGNGGGDVRYTAIGAPDDFAPG